MAIGTVEASLPPLLVCQPNGLAGCARAQQLLPPARSTLEKAPLLFGTHSRVFEYALKTVSLTTVPPRPPAIRQGNSLTPSEPADSIAASLRIERGQMHALAAILMA